MLGSVVLGRTDPVHDGGRMVEEDSSSSVSGIEKNTGIQWQQQFSEFFGWLRSSGAEKNNRARGVRLALELLVQGGQTPPFKLSFWLSNFWCNHVLLDWVRLFFIQCCQRKRRFKVNRTQP